MQDDFPTAALVTGRPKRNGTALAMIAVVAFILGGAAVAWAAAEGYLARLTRSDTPASATELPEPIPENGSEQAPKMSAQDMREMAAVSSVEARVAMLEDRLSRLDFQATAASGNAARAEGLLIAFAARRMIDRGEPIGFVADQLRLRFANAQPKAVDTIVAFSRNPVTIDQLSARLEALSPELTDKPKEMGLWEQARHEFAGLFVVRRDSSQLLSPGARIERAKLMLTSRRINNAIAEVQRLPGAAAAEKWVTDARRYEDVQRALDLVETTAMLEPRRLQDAAGKSVEQESPLAAPADESAPIELEADAAVPAPEN